MSFADILKTPTKDIEAPKPTPEGQWRFAIQSTKIQDNRDGDGYVFLAAMKPQEPGPDVDEDETAEFDADAAIEFVRFNVRNAGDAHRVKRFLENAGVELGGALEDDWGSAQGHEIMAEVVHGDLRDDGTPFVNLRNFAAV